MQQQEQRRRRPQKVPAVAVTTHARIGGVIPKHHSQTVSPGQLEQAFDGDLALYPGEIKTTDGISALRPVRDQRRTFLLTPGDGEYATHRAIRNAAGKTLGMCIGIPYSIFVGYDSRGNPKYDTIGTTTVVENVNGGQCSHNVLSGSVQLKHDLQLEHAVRYNNVRWSERGGFWAGHHEEHMVAESNALARAIGDEPEQPEFVESAADNGELYGAYFLLDLQKKAGASSTSSSSSSPSSSSPSPSPSFLSPSATMACRESLYCTLARQLAVSEPTIKEMLKQSRSMNHLKEKFQCSCEARQGKMGKGRPKTQTGGWVAGHPHKSCANGQVLYVKKQIGKLGKVMFQSAQYY